MAEVLYRAHVFAPATTPLVLYGASGTGKTFLAEYIHGLSGREGGFHAFGVGTMAPQLALDELFGHVPGAYTDARRPRPGRIATAGSGTLLLDDVQNLDLGVQKQLLQVLDRKTFSPVGTDRIVVVGCRFIFAMTEDPDVLMQEGRLLRDLRYRLRACHIRVPPLGERREEIALLAQRALERCPAWTGLDGPTRFTGGALALLEGGEYKGNVRDLEGFVERAYLEARYVGAEAIRPEHLPDDLCPTLKYVRRGDAASNRRAVERALQRAGGNQAEAARMLGVARNTVRGVVASEHSPIVEMGSRARSRRS